MGTSSKQAKLRVRAFNVKVSSYRSSKQAKLRAGGMDLTGFTASSKQAKLRGGYLLTLVELTVSSKQAKLRDTVVVYLVGFSLFKTSKTKSRLARILLSLVYIVQNKQN